MSQGWLKKKKKNCLKDFSNHYKNSVWVQNSISNLLLDDIDETKMKWKQKLFNSYQNLKIKVVENATCKGA